MREECKQFESRTYANGETVRKCNLDLAPDAPWRCPADCPKYERRLVDAGWQYGSLAPTKAPEEPPAKLDADVAALLDEAEDIVNAAGPQILADIQAQRAGRGAGARVKGWFRRKR